MITEWNDRELLKDVGNAVEVACMEGAEAVAATARRMVKKKTGTLAGQIEVKASKFKDGGAIVQAQGPGNYGKFYATFVELGTHKDPKQPFLRPALAANKRKIQRNFEDKIR
ncbi:MAG: HK97-gp10 family putative phage morphogenesis protein [Pseudomonadota bacterium]